MQDVQSAPDDRLLRAVAETAGQRPRVLLAVSGGRDSMVLLHAAVRALGASRCAVATFDHGTGPAAVRATRLVLREAACHDVPCLRGHATEALSATEAAWRAARWRFLRGAAARLGADGIATAHTRDDQIQTVMIRILRASGARGLAGLDVDSDVLRPLLGLSRAAVATYATTHGIPFVDDPSNHDPRYLRNRVRRHLLPALRAAHPPIEDELLEIGARAASWRRRVEDLVARELPVQKGNDGISVAANDLDRYDAESLAILWPAIAAQAGVALDRRGTDRLVGFTRRARVGGVIQLSGGFEVRRSRFSFVLDSASPDAPERTAASALEEIK